MSKEYPVGEKKPSKMFVKALQGGGSSNIACHCGRRHYAPNNCHDYEDVQYMRADAKEQQLADPDGVVIQEEDDFIYYKELHGMQFVVDCPCNSLRKYEDFVWNSRNYIREYYTIRIGQELRFAEQETLLNKLAGI